MLKITFKVSLIFASFSTATNLTAINQSWSDGLCSTSLTAHAATSELIARLVHAARNQILTKEKLEQILTNRSSIGEVFSRDALEIKVRPYLDPIVELVQLPDVDWNEVEKALAQIFSELEHLERSKKKNQNFTRELVNPHLVAQYRHYYKTPLSAPPHLLGLDTHSPGFFILGSDAHWSRIDLNGEISEGENPLRSIYKTQEIDTEGKPIQIFNPKTQRYEGLQLVYQSSSPDSDNAKLRFFSFSLTDPNDITPWDIQLDVTVESSPVYYSWKNEHFVIFRAKNNLKQLNQLHSFYIRIRLSDGTPDIEKLTIRSPRSEAEIFLSRSGAPLLVETSSYGGVRIINIHEPAMTRFDLDLATRAARSLTQMGRNTLDYRYNRPLDERLPISPRVHTRKFLLQSGHQFLASLNSISKIGPLRYRSPSFGLYLGPRKFVRQGNLPDVYIPEQDILLMPGQYSLVGISRSGVHQGTYTPFRTMANLEQDENEQRSTLPLSFSESHLSYNGHHLVLVCWASKLRDKPAQTHAALLDVNTLRRFDLPEKFSRGCVGELFEYEGNGYAIIRDSKHHFLYQIY